MSIGTDSMGSWSGSAGNNQLHAYVVRTCRCIASRLQHGVRLRLNRLGSLPLVRADFGFLLARKRWRAKVIVNGMLFFGHVTAGCRAPTHARKRTYVYSVHTYYVQEYLDTQ